MDAIAIMVALFVNWNALCSAQPVQLTDIGGSVYQIQSWRCGERTFRTWARGCPDGTTRVTDRTYWSRPFLLEETAGGAGFYMNQFGELYAGHHVMLAETYVPRCGS